MTAEVVQLIIFGVEEAIKEEPAVASELQTLLSKKDPTPADWSAVRQRLLSKSYEDYDPAPIASPAPAPAAMPAAIIPLPSPATAAAAASCGAAALSSPIDVVTKTLIASGSAPDPLDKPASAPVAQTPAPVQNAELPQHESNPE